MGQKVNPIGFRLALSKDWRSRWYASSKEFSDFLHADLRIRHFVKQKLSMAAVAKIVIERAWNSIRVTIYTARPGIVIGRKGAEIEKMTEEITRMSGGKQVKIDIQEIKTPELDAQLVSENVALQIERRISFRRAMKKAVQTTIIPLHTLRTPIDYGFAEANTVYGKIGVKCWICKPEQILEQQQPQKKETGHQPAPASR